MLIQIEEKEKAKINFLKSQMEKNYYLGEFKENILIALTKEQLETGIIYPEVFEAMKEEDAILLKMRRDISLKYLKAYIEEAEKIKLRYTLVASLENLGDIGLVVVSKDDLNNSDKDIILDNIEKIFTDVGLSKSYSKAIGKKICKKHYEELEKKLPTYKGLFQKMNFWDKLFGRICPIDEDERRRNND
jgi:uncharacterized protein YueI